MKVLCVDLGHDLRSKPVSGVEVGGGGEKGNVGVGEPRVGCI